MRSRPRLASVVIGTAVLFDTTTAHAIVSLSEAVRSTMVFLHVLGTVMFMGNVIVSAMWMSQARRADNAVILHFAAKSVIRADWLFTLPGIVLILGTGLLTVGRWGGFPRAAWAELALALFVLSGAIWGGVLVRLQKRLARMTAQVAESGARPDEGMHGVVRRWVVWGGIATALLFAALVLMVFKPVLWG